MTLKLLLAALAFTLSTPAMARSNGIAPGYGYQVSERDFKVWNRAAYHYYHPRCYCCRW